MSKKHEWLANAIYETLDYYKKDVEDAVDNAARESIEELVAITRRTAPYQGHRKYIGSGEKHGKHFRSQIIYSKVLKSRARPTYVWHVVGWKNRLTHLLVHGHDNPLIGKRVEGNPFLKNACDTVFPKFEKAVEEAVKPK